MLSIRVYGNTDQVIPDIWKRINNGLIIDKQNLNQFSATDWDCKCGLVLGEESILTLA